MPEDKQCQSDGCDEQLVDRSDGRGTRFVCPQCGGTWLEGTYTDGM